jgi:alkylation response protein AidB-like acyl-CoA dehydrogenase
MAIVPSHEEALLREAVAGICGEFGQEYMRRKHDAGEPPSELWDALASRGYLGVNVPAEYDGGGLGMAALSWVGEEIAAAGCGLLLIVVSPAIVGSILTRHGTAAQKERWLRGIGSGATKVAFAITEADAGSNSHNLATSLRRERDRYLLRGQKTFISGVEDADAVLVVARTRLADGQLGLPSLAIVDVDAPGFTRQEIPMAVRGADKQWTLSSSTTWSRGRRLDRGRENGGLGVVFDGLNPERIMGASICTGGHGWRSSAVPPTRASAKFGGSRSGAHQGVAHPLAEAKIELELARPDDRKAAALCDAGVPGAGEAANMAKYAAAEAAIHSVDRAIQAHGATASRSSTWPQ